MAVYMGEILSPNVTFGSRPYQITQEKAPHRLRHSVLTSPVSRVREYRYPDSMCGGRFKTKTVLTIEIRIAASFF